MTAAEYGHSSSVDVVHAVEEAFGGRSAARVVGREPSPFATFFPAEVVTVRLRAGAVVQVFAKHLDARDAEHPEKHCRDRELRVYTELLAGDDLPAVSCYGGWWDEGAGQGLLLLEHIDDWNLKYQDLAHWETAARRLAHLHRSFAQERRQRLDDADFLLDLDEHYLAGWADRAVTAVGSLSQELAARLAAVVTAWVPATGILSGQPRTLVHNDLAPKNVLADRAADPARICVVDWEVAGRGYGVLDLVHLSYGFDAAHERWLWSAYCEELVGTELVPDDQAERAALFAACCLHKTLYRLAYSATWRLPLDRVTEWVGDAERQLRQAVRL